MCNYPVSNIQYPVSNIQYPLFNDGGANWILAVGYWILDICTLSEVNYEQSIIAPAANFLCEIFLVTKGERPGQGARLRKPLAGERHLQAAGHHPRREKW